MSNCDNCYKNGNCGADLGDAACQKNRRPPTPEETAAAQADAAKWAAVGALREAQTAASLKATADREAAECREYANELPVRTLGPRTPKG